MDTNTPEDLFFGDLLRQFRKRKRLNQKQLAERIEVSRETVSLWERGEYKPEADRILYAIVDALGLSAQEQQQLFEAYTVTALVTSFHNSPFKRNPYFTGRISQLNQLHMLLMAGKQVALTRAISGLGGIGKTQLALEYAYRYQKSYHETSCVAGAPLLMRYLNGLRIHLLGKCGHRRIADDIVCSTCRPIGFARIPRG